MIRHSTLRPRPRVNDHARRFGSFLRRQTVFLKALAFVGCYALWVKIFKLIVLTFVTFFLSSAANRPARFDEISDAFASSELTLMGLCAGAFVLLLRALHPLTTTSTAEIVTPERLERKVIPGFLHGSVMASGLILAFLLSGLYGYLGFFVQFESQLLAVFTILLRIASVTLLVYCEEFIFRHKILTRLRPENGKLGAHLGLAAWTAILYCLVKTDQFDLSRMHLITLFLLSLSLAVRTFLDDDFGRGAGFLAALLVVFHPLLSLPILGNEFSGVILIKPQPDMDAASRIFTGGAGGPLSSLALQLLLVLDILKGTLRYRETVSATSENF